MKGLENEGEVLSLSTGMLMMGYMGVARIWGAEVVNSRCHDNNHGAPMQVWNAHDVRVCGRDGMVCALTRLAAAADSRKL